MRFLDTEEPARDTDYEWEVNRRNKISLEMEEVTDPEGEYPVRVSVDSTLECFVFLSFMKAWELSLVLITIVVYVITTYEVFLEGNKVRNLALFGV